MSQSDDSPALQEPRLAKRLLREQLRLAKRELAQDERDKQSAKICQRLLGSHLWKENQSVLLYFPLPTEVDIKLLIEKGLDSGKTISLPRFEPRTKRYEIGSINGLEDVVEGAFGVSEPSPDCPEIDPKQLDLGIVPGVGFDALGTRLGRGGGYYDRLLQGLTATVCGVCFREQVLPRIPEEAHDIKMDWIATPDGWLINDST